MAVAALLAIAVLGRPDAPGAGGVERGVSLALVDGSAPVAVEAGTELALRLADRSVITLAPGARIAPTANDASRFELALARGHARFEVEPGGPRRWRIDCGPVIVEVIGTVFEIDRDETRIRVSVEHGIVAVRGERVPGGTRRLGAGESIEIVLREIAAAPVAPAPPVAPPPADARPTPVAAARGARVERWESLAEEGEHARAYEELGATGVEERVARAGTHELMLLADVARLSGHPDEAIAPLERVLAEHPGDAQAPLAAFILGGIQRSRGAHADAATAFARADELGVPAALREDARAAIAVERGRAGDIEGADAAARRYLEHHPAGARADDVQRWLRSAP